jgi:hypothetical protein
MYGSGQTAAATCAYGMPAEVRADARRFTAKNFNSLYLIWFAALQHI